MNDEITNDFLSRENMRSLAAYILDQIQHGDINENVQQVGSFITNMLAGLLFGGAANIDHAIDGLDALYDDVETLIRTNFDAAKAAMAENDAKMN